MVVLAGIKDTHVAGSQSDHIGRIDCQHFNSINTRLVSIIPPTSSIPIESFSFSAE